MKRKIEPGERPSIQIVNTPYSFWHDNTWSHVELGAANYGDKVDGDPTHEAIGGISGMQFSILFKTADELIEKKGNKGIIYINDLKEEMVAYTIKNLQEYIDEHHQNHKIELRPLVGDYFKIDIPKVTSIHLKNPEFYFFASLKGDNAKRVAYFAERAKEGLILVTYFKDDFLNLVHDLGVVSKVLNNNYCAYIHADGAIIKREGNVVQFSIQTPRHSQERLRPRYPKVIVNEETASIA